MVAYVNIPVFRNSHLVVEPIIFCCICLLALLHLGKIKTCPQISKFEIASLLFVLYSAIKDTMLGVFDISFLAQPLLLVVVYVTLKSCFATYRPDLMAVLWSSAALIILFAGVLLYKESISDTVINDLFTPNKSILSVLLACHLAFILPILLTIPTSRSWFWLMLLIMVLCAGMLYLTGGRAGWIGLIAGVSLAVYYKFKRKSWLTLSFTVVTGLVVLAALTFFYKRDSSQGRVLIYKVSGEMFMQNWLWGIGGGQFKVRYNEFQAQYFAGHSIDSKEALLADNTFYAFNDFFEILIESGGIGFLLYVTAVVFFVRRIGPALKNSEPIYLAALGSLICISTAAFFSYPLRSFPIAMQVAGFLALLSTFSNSKSSPVFVLLGGFVYRPLLLLAFLLLVLHFSYMIWYRTESHRAFTLSRGGFKKEALKKYERLSNSYIKEGHTCYLYARELYYAERLDHADRVLQNLKRYYCNHEVYILSAKIAEGKGNYQMAEQQYLFAINMVPNRMLSRFELLNFYVKQKDTVNAIYWAESILNMPVKVPSSITNALQQKVAGLLSQLKDRPSH